ncbi:MAG: HrpE/YscL family type III secretion apparatus protein [Duodenibacillus sp.]|nr:HrpE/YscL family type III secretion apparatus protein [Duodenibacillus sp.]
MGEVFRLISKDVPTPAPGVKVVKAAECSSAYEATAIIDAARQRAADIEARAEADYQVRFDAGYADGLEAGKMENAEKMMETVLASVEFIENIEKTVVSVVTQSIRKIIGELDDETRIKSIVSQALTNVRGQQQVTVRVCPSDEPYVAKALAAMTSGSFLKIVADGRLDKNSCILESDLGVIDASLETQLKALEHAFSEQIEQQG